MKAADLTYHMIDTPATRWCEGLKGGHVAPETFRRGGAGTEAFPTQFYRVATPAGLDMVVCELCLAVAQAVGQQKRREKKKAGEI